MQPSPSVTSHAEQLALLRSREEEIKRVESRLAAAERQINEMEIKRERERGKGCKGWGRRWRLERELDKRDMVWDKPMQSQVCAMLSIWVEHVLLTLVF